MTEVRAGLVARLRALLGRIGLRLLAIKQVAVANMLPALIISPLLTWVIASLR